MGLVMGGPVGGLGFIHRELYHIRACVDSENFPGVPIIGRLEEFPFLKCLWFFWIVCVYCRRWRWGGEGRVPVFSDTLLPIG